MAHHTGGILFLCELHKLGKTEIQHIVASHNQQLIRQVQLFDCQLNIFDCSQTSFIGTSAIIDHSNLIRPNSYLLVLPIFKMLCELVVGNHHKFINVGGIHQIIHQPVKDGFLANFQKWLWKILSQRVEPRGVTSC